MLTYLKIVCFLYVWLYNFMSQNKNGTTTNSRQEIKICMKYFSLERAEWKRSWQCPNFCSLQAKQETGDKRQKRKTKRGEVESFYSLKKWEWKEAYMLFTMQWSKILVLQLFTMQWSKRMILQSHDATKQKQKNYFYNYLRCNEAENLVLWLFTMQ